MLYISTRTQAESFTGHRVMHLDKPSDGGLFVPFRMPEKIPDEICRFRSGSFSENIAQVLNYFLSTKLTGWEIECYGGKTPFKLAAVGEKITIAEIWHNPGKEYEYFEKALSSGIAGNCPTVWFRTALRVAVLFGLFSETHFQKSLDLSIEGDDMTMPLAVVYARKLGLPLGSIIVNFRENSSLWNFFHHGELSTSSPVPASMEPFLYETLSQQEADRYRAVLENHGVYRLSPQLMDRLRQFRFVPAVVGGTRAQAIADQLREETGYRIDIPAAISLGGLLDYRSKNGNVQQTLLLYQNCVKE